MFLKLCLMFSCAKVSNMRWIQQRSVAFLYADTVRKQKNFRKDSREALSDKNSKYSNCRNQMGFGGYANLIHIILKVC